MARRNFQPVPEELCEELDLMLGEDNFRNSADLSGWLMAHGYAIAPAPDADSDLFESRLEEVRQITEQARQVVSASPDEEGGINEALVRLVQQRLFEILTAMEVRDLKKTSLSALARSVAEMSRASVMQKRWLNDMRTKVQAKVKVLEATVDDAANNAGLSPETEQRIRNALLEIQV